MRCFFPEIVYIDTGREGLRCDAMRCDTMEKGGRRNQPLVIRVVHERGRQQRRGDEHQHEAVERQVCPRRLHGVRPGVHTVPAGGGTGGTDARVARVGS